jgi:hypothetical protein
MSHYDEWQALAARIRGLSRAGELHMAAYAAKSSDSFGRYKYLGRKSQEVVVALQDFKEKFNPALSANAVAAIETFLQDAGNALLQPSPGGDLRLEQVHKAIVVLTDFEAELAYLLSDRQQLIRSRAELALAHLQRLLAVDDDLGKKWTKAFKQGETQCEKLGGLHCLWHGILGFKINAAGARTDLVLNDVISDSVAGAALGLVLTEWKVANEQNAETRLEEARRQTKLYKAGVLGAMELIGYRYLVVVTAKQVALPGDKEEDGISYRHVNIAVDPRTPSVQAKRSS